MFPDTLWTEDLILRPIALGDTGAIFDEYAQDPEVTRYLTWAPHTSVRETEEFITGCIASETSRTFTLLGRRDRQLRGALTIRRDVPGRIGFGYVLSRRSWNQGLMTEALTEVVAWAMKQRDVWRIGAPATSTTSRPRASWRRRASIARGCSSAGWCIRTSRIPARLLDVRQSPLTLRPAARNPRSRSVPSTNPSRMASAMASSSRSTARSFP